MTVYAVGNPDDPKDNRALKIPGVQVLTGDLPTDEDLIIVDVVEGIKKVTVFNDVDKFVSSPRNTVHDFDLGFQLKYLKKIGKLGRVTIVGLPMTGEIDYDQVQSILRKLVAQDMQGS